MAGVSRHCIAILGGSFDPVHSGHVALAHHFVDLLKPDELRILPAGNPWQKHGLEASGAQRVAMLERAFQQQDVPVLIDQRELQSTDPTFTIDTLRALRAELGPAVSLVFLMGADQLQHLDTWNGWRELFDFAHVCAAARPGFALDGPQVPDEVRQAFEHRAGTPAQIRTTPQGKTFLAPNLAVDISATEIRAALRQGKQPDTLVPHAVLDYIQQHHLYKS
ncbi:nicotinate-nucleotide adenylyltransferase [Actimicrobium sp. CCC2.4]|nr:nicotinate-nucleotide adenylyltransferase [Actimicrobium sp. CCC2.4]MEB0135855.1 nicotinate-nucleotide adenylyltransferase [Actimicrobium sp. CCC2.4]WPX34110.1 nicotinate-nucleotide adenylyltransferase [Actimicrobium sp. CCC2.4]